MTFRLATTLTLAAALAACGGGSPLDNSETIANPAAPGGRKLSFIYFQKCINPVLLTVLVGELGPNRCADAGCHDSGRGTGGALRVVESATEVDASGPPDQLRETDMYKNFYSSQGAVTIGVPGQSRLFTKPRLIVQHAGGKILPADTDPAAQLIAYWITHPMPENQDEFSTAGNALFDPNTGACNR